MMENILTNYRNYHEGRKGALEAYQKGSKALNDKYKGAMLESKIEALKRTYRTTLKGLEENNITPIDEAFAAAEAAVRAAAAKPIPKDLWISLAAFDGLKISDAEKSIILEMTRNSYLARKRAIELLNLKDDALPLSVDTVLGNIKMLKDVLVRSIRKPVDSYDARLIAHGDLVSNVQNEVTAFCDTYGE